MSNSTRQTIPKAWACIFDFSLSARFDFAHLGKKKKTHIAMGPAPHCFFFFFARSESLKNKLDGSF